MANSAIELFGVGHNRPPLDPPEALSSRLQNDYRELLSKLAQAEARAGQLADPIESDAQSAAAMNWRTEDWKPARDAVENARKEEVKPYNAGAKAINEFFNPVIKTSDEKAKRIADRLAIFRDVKEREQRAREQARRRAAEREAAEKRAEAQRLAEAAAAAADAERAAELSAQAISANRQALIADDIAALKPQPVNIHGDHGNTGYMRSNWKFFITDIDALPEDWWCPDLVAIEQELKQCIKDNGKPPVIPGVEFYDDPTFVPRRC